MARGSLVFSVARPPSAVFELLADLERAPEWVPDLVSVEKTTPGPVGVGTRYSEVVQMGKQTSTAELEVTEYERDRVFAHDGEGGPSRFSARFTLKPEGDGTRVTHEYTVRLRGLFKLMTPFIMGWVRKNSQAATVELKRLLES